MLILCNTGTAVGLVLLSVRTNVCVEIISDKTKVFTCVIYENDKSGRTWSIWNGQDWFLCWYWCWWWLHYWWHSSPVLGLSCFNYVEVILITGQVTEIVFLLKRLVVYHFYLSVHLLENHDFRLFLCMTISIMEKYKKRFTFWKTFLCSTRVEENYKVKLTISKIVQSSA